MAAAETAGRPAASRLELLRARLHHDSGRSRLTGQRTSSVHDPVQTGGSHTALNGLRPAPPRPGAGRLDSKPDRRLQAGNNITNHDRQLPAVSHRTQVNDRSKPDVGVDGQQYAQVRKPASASVSSDRGQTGLEDACHQHQRTPAGHNDPSTAAKPRRLQAQKTSSSSSSLLSKSQNFFARLRSRKNDPAKTTSKSRDGGSGSNTKIRRSISESGCAMYANRAQLAGSDENVVDTSPRSAHADVVTSSDDVRTQRRTVDKPPETVESNAVDDSTNDHVTTTSVYAEVEPLTSSMLTAGPGVAQPPESTSGPEQASCSVYEECAGSYSLREALLRRGADTAPADPPTSTTSSHIIRPASASSSDDDQVARRKAQTSASMLPVGGAVTDACSRSMLMSGWRRRKLATTQSAGSVVGGGRLERIQEVDSPPGSAGDVDMSLRSPSLRVTEQRASDARNCKFINNYDSLLVHVLW